MVLGTWASQTEPNWSQKVDFFWVQKSYGGCQAHVACGWELHRRQRPPRAQWHWLLPCSAHHRIYGAAQLGLSLDRQDSNVHPGVFVEIRSWVSSGGWWASWGASLLAQRSCSAAGVSSICLSTSLMLDLSIREFNELNLRQTNTAWGQWTKLFIWFIGRKCTPARRVWNSVHCQFIADIHTSRFIAARALKRSFERPCRGPFNAF